MHLRIGCRLEISCATVTPVLTLVHPHASLLGDLRGPEAVQLSPDRSFEVLSDSSGNRWSRWLAPAGVSSLALTCHLERPGNPDPVVPTAPQCPVGRLPIHAYGFLNASPYCDTGTLMDLAWTTFPPGLHQGWALVQAICDWVHEQIRFDLSTARSEKTASDTLREGAGVCRDFAHLAITLCRCLNIPARYCTGYLGYIGVPPGEAPVDFSAWFEAFLGDRWYVFDARHNVPRCGRVLIARGLDAGDVPFLRSFGSHQLRSLGVSSEVLNPGASPRQMESVLA